MCAAEETDMPKLVIRMQDGSGQEHEFAGEIVIGRDQEAPLQILDTKVSRKHCRIYLEAGMWRFEDLGSANGSKVNGFSKTACPLESGDKIEIGQTVLTFKGDPPKKYATVKRTSARDRLGHRRKK
jgi:pSer/pThr/pTyr-binding forkhead associated (FHA) protein